MIDFIANIIGMGIAFYFGQLMVVVFLMCHELQVLGDSKKEVYLHFIPYWFLVLMFKEIKSNIDRLDK